MIPYFSIESFYIGPFKFYAWGFFVALAFLVGLILAIWQAKKIGISTNKIIWLIIFVYVGALVGGRLFFILQWPRDFLADPLQILSVAEGGMMFYGGLVGGILAGWLYIRKWENRWQVLSALSPVIPLALAIGRLGCFLSNDHQGGLTNLPWAIRWPDGTLRHPVALYLILFDLVLAGVLWWRGRRFIEIIHPSSVEEGAGGGGVNFQHPTSILPSSEGEEATLPFFLFLHSLPPRPLPA